jgi:hypothetical protein
MTDAPRITYTSHLGSTTRTELDALSRVFRFVLFESSARKRDRIPNSGPQDTRGELEIGSRIKPILPP